MTWHVVTGDFPPAFTGGVASWTWEVAQVLPGVQVHARRAPWRWWWSERSLDRGFRVHRIPGSSWNRDQAAHARRHLQPHLRSGDVVLATTWPVAVELVEPCRKAGVPLLVTAHGSEVTRLGTHAPRELEVLARYARFGAVSRYLAGILGHHGIRAVVLPAPVSAHPPREGTGSTLLTVCRSTPLKGVDRVIRLGEVLGWPVVVVGEGHRRMGKGVRFAGRVRREDLPRFFQQARLVAQLSRAAQDGSGAEGLGLVPLEAAAWGVPSVVSGVGGLPEAVGPGLVLPDPDDPVASSEIVRAWWSPDRGREQHAFVSDHHGPLRTAHALLRLAGAP